MTWKRFQRVIQAVLAVCVGAGIALGVTDRMGLVLVLGPVDSTAVWAADFLLFLLALLAWGDGAIIAHVKGWLRVISLAGAVAAEGLFMMAVVFFLLFFDCGTRYVPLPGPDGETALVAAEESWLLGGWGRFYLPVCPGLIRSTGAKYTTDDGFRPFSAGKYWLECGETQIIVHYHNGAGGWESCAVPLDERRSAHGL